MDFDPFAIAEILLSAITLLSGYVGLLPLDPLTVSGIAAVLAGSAFGLRLFLKKRIK